VPGFSFVGWYGVIAPAKLPAPILARLNDEFQKLLKRPEVRERITSDGAEPANSTPEEFRHFMLADVEKWAKLVRETGAKLE